MKFNGSHVFLEAAHQMPSLVSSSPLCVICKEQINCFPPLYKWGREGLKEAILRPSANMITARQVVLHQWPSLMAQRHFLGALFFLSSSLFASAGGVVFFLVDGRLFCCVDDRWRRVCGPISHTAQQRSWRAASAAVDCEQPRGRM